VSERKKKERKKERKKSRGKKRKKRNQAKPRGATESLPTNRVSLSLCLEPKTKLIIVVIVWLLE